jgi:maleate isomerase
MSNRTDIHADGAVVPRVRMALIVPSTNVVAETDMWRTAPPDVTFHTGRMFVGNPNMSSNEAFLAFLDQIRAALDTAVRDVMTCEPDYLVMGMSAETFWGGAEGNAEFTRKLKSLSGLQVATGADACLHALETYGVSRLAVLTPYQPVGDEQVRRYFTEIGYEIVRLKGLRCPNATAPSKVSTAELRRALEELDGPDVEALVQVGTNLSMVRLADKAERELRKPVVAINAAILWTALRDYGIQDQYPGFGALLREH